MPNYPKSDHYDGAHFFNPTHSANTLWDGAKMFLSIKFEDWPAFVENDTKPELHHELKKDEVVITFVNHATVLVQTARFNFLTDPVWSERVSPVGWVGPKRHRKPGISFEELTKIDFVLISHNHYDHMDLSTLKKLNTLFHPQFFVPLGNKNFLESEGIENVTEMDWWQSVSTHSEVKINLTPADHFSGRGVFDRDKTLWGSFVVEFDNHSIYFAGDTAYSSHFKETYDRFGPPSIALLPIGAYDPRWFMKVVHMNPEEAVQAHLDLHASQSIGIHFGTFQLTSEKISQPVEDLAEALKNKNLPTEKFITLSEGKTQLFLVGADSSSR